MLRRTSKKCTKALLVLRFFERVPRILGLEKSFSAYGRKQAKHKGRKKVTSNFKVNYESIFHFIIFLCLQKSLTFLKRIFLHSVLYRVPRDIDSQQPQSYNTSKKGLKDFFLAFCCPSYSFKKAKEMRTMCMTITTTHAYPIEQRPHQSKSTAFLLLIAVEAQRPWQCQNN